MGECPPPKSHFLVSAWQEFLETQRIRTQRETAHRENPHTDDLKTDDLKTDDLKTECGHVVYTHSRSCLLVHAVRFISVSLVGRLFFHV